MKWLLCLLVLVGCGSADPDHTRELDEVESRNVGKIGFTKLDVVTVDGRRYLVAHRAGNVRFMVPHDIDEPHVTGDDSEVLRWEMNDPEETRVKQWTP